MAITDALEEAAMLVGPTGQLLHANPVAARRWGALEPGMPGPDLAAALDADVDALGELTSGAGERGMPAPFALARLEGSAGPVVGLDGVVLLRFAATGTGAPRSAAVAELAARVELLAEASRHRQLELDRAEARHGRVIGAMHDGLVVQDADGRIVACNPAASGAVGLTEKQLVGHDLAELPVRFVREDGAEWPTDGHPVVHTLRTGEPVHDVRMGVQRVDGTLRWLDLTTTALPDGRGAFATFVDVTERLERDRELLVARERLRLAFEDAPAGVAVVALDGRWTQVNRALCELLGRSEEELCGGMTFQDVTHPDDLEQDLALVEEVLGGVRRSFVVEKRFLPEGDGSPLWVQLAVSLVRDAAGEPDCFICHVQDISERRRHEGELRHLADHDALTSLVNRRRFADELTRELQRLRRGGSPASLVMLDLDRFKDVNDRHGHKAGDDLICAVAAALLRRLRATDVVGRLGGDEFAMLLPETPVAVAQRVADDLLAHVRSTQITLAGGEQVGVTASAGVVELDPGSLGPSDDLVLADLAMYEAKAAGRDRAAGARPDLAASA